MDLLALSPQNQLEFVILDVNMLWKLWRFFDISFSNYRDRYDADMYDVHWFVVNLKERLAICWCWEKNFTSWISTFILSGDLEDRAFVEKIFYQRIWWHMTYDMQLHGRISGIQILAFITGSNCFAHLYVCYMYVCIEIMASFLFSSIVNRSTLSFYY